LLVPQRTDVTLPSDFKGLTPLPYSTAEKSSARALALGPVVDRISAIIDELGVRASMAEKK
jgi:predicted nucleotide-binding protein